jgi:hypothetical protein
MHRFIPVLMMNAGARVLQVPVRHHPRTAGKTKYNLTRTFRVVLDLMTVKFLASYVTRPMHVFGSAGLASIGFGILSAIATVVMKKWMGPLMPHNSLLLLSVMFVLVGVQFLSIGLLGELMTRTYFESQGKRAYLVRNALNFDEREKRQAA